MPTRPGQRRLTGWFRACALGAIYSLAESQLSHRPWTGKGCVIASRGWWGLYSFLARARPRSIPDYFASARSRSFSNDRYSPLAEGPQRAPSNGRAEPLESLFYHWQPDTVAV